MTDTSMFQSASSFAAPSEFNAAQIDRNLRQISTIERTWGLPALPVETKFDLATQQGADEDSLSTFLTGLEADLAAVDAEAEAEEPLSPRSITPYELSGIDQARIVLAGVAGAPAPELPTGDAVQLLKRRAVDEGYVDPNFLDPEDPSWDPELNGIRGEMVFDDYNARQLGDRPGAAPLKGVMGLLNDFTSPTGLLSAATKLDLFWDVGAISKEISSWGDKWREVGNSKGPMEFAGNLIDALTGPLDDIIIPVANVALLATGIGAVANTARIGFMGAKISQSTGLLRGLYSTGRAASNWRNLGEASWTAQKLMGSAGAGRQAVGSAMAAWRQTLAVRGTRSVLQPGMRLGFAHEAEERLGTYRSDGLSLDNAPGVAGAAEAVKNFGYNPAALPLEMFLAPYNIWVPGTFTSAGGRAGRLATRAAGSSVGRAAVGGLAGTVVGTVTGEDAGDIAQGALVGAGVGAGLPAAGRVLQSAVGRAGLGVAAGAGMGALMGDSPDDIAFGAIAGAGLIAAPASLKRFLPNSKASLVDRTLAKIGSGLQHTSFSPVADDQRVALAFNRGMETHLANDTERLAKWQEDVRAGGVKHALAEMQTGGDEETAAATIGFVFMSAAIDRTARAQASMVGGRLDQYHMFRNKLTSQLRDFDLSEVTDATIREIAHARAFAESSNLKEMRKAFRRLLVDMNADRASALEWAAKHNESAHESIRQLMSGENMPDLAEVGQMDIAGRAIVMEEYMPQVGDTFGNFPVFTGLTSQIRQATMDGHLAAMTLAPVKNRRGNWIVPDGPNIAGLPTDNPTVLATNRNISDLLFGGRAVDGRKARRLGRFTPLARALSPGRPTVMLRETMDWQELKEVIEELADIKDAGMKLRGLPNPRAEFERARSKATGLVKGQLDQLDPTTSVGTWSKGQIKGLVNALPGKQRDRWRYVLDYAKRKGLTLDEVGLEVNRAVDEKLGDADLWARIGMEPTARRVGQNADGTANVKVLTGLDALEDLVKRLDEKAKYTAKRIDVEQLVKYHTDQGDDAAAAAVRELADGLDRDGYKLVHGVEFLMPEDLAHGPIFGDVTARHLNAATLGNAFKGRLPIEARAIEDRRQRLALADELTRATGQHVAPDADKVNWALEDLHALLRQQHDSVEHMLLDLHNQTSFDRLTSRVKSSFTPVRLDDLSSKKRLIQEFLATRGYSPEEALAVWKASNRFRNTSFRDMGLYALESKLRSTNNVGWALKTLSGSKHYENLTNPSEMQKLWLAGRGKRYLGAVAGAAVGRSQAGEDATFEEQLGAAVMGGLAGAGAVTVGSRAIGAMGANKAAKHVENFRFGYMADGLARLRDSLRFTLSPFFDLSRYTEGLMLAQTAAPLRNADGTRLALPLNMSPKGIRSTLRKEFAEAGVADPNAAAWGRYEQYVKEFNHAARGDYDPDALDSTGRWFTQIGILGFSPTDWMSTAFGHLRRQGMGAEEAYKAARSMYTYGTRGRSAAELSVNFVFFPFSFQKKALTHLSKWMNDDLSRSLMIHDALKTYEILDEKYDLDNFWREHVPVLRQLQKLNLFAYGLSPGRFGGINRQLFESSGKVAWNLFVPAGLQIRDSAASTEAKEVMRSLTPALNDINWMTENLKEQGHVLFSQHHVTTDAEVRQGYGAWNQFKEDFGAELDAKGYKWADLQQPWMAEAKAYYEAKKAELADRYPAWQKQRTESIFEAQAIEMERDLRLQRVQAAALGGTPASVDDQQLAQFDNYLTGLQDRAELLGFGRNWEDAPPEIYRDVRSTALQFLELNPGWRALWEKFYRRDFGPITVPATNSYLDAMGA